VPGLEQVAHGGPGLARQSLAECAAVWVGVDGDDAVAAQRREHRAECGRGGGLADAALQADDGEPVAVAHGRSRGRDQSGQVPVRG
jgi:hypothetical protein